MHLADVLQACLQGYMPLKRHVTWTRMVTHSIGHVTCRHAQKLIELHIVTSVAAARLLEEGHRRRGHVRKVLERELSKELESSSSDIFAIQESILALAIVSAGHVTLHSVESEDQAAAAAGDDDRALRDDECRRLFSETLAEGGMMVMMMSLKTTIFI
jgi:hypothetical protein